MSDIAINILNKSETYLMETALGSYGYGKVSKCCEAVYVDTFGLLTFLLLWNVIGIRQRGRPLKGPY